MMRSVYICLLILWIVGCANSAKNFLEDGKTAYKNKQYESALASLQSAVREDPGMEEAHYYLGNLYRDWKNEEEFEGKKGLTLAIEEYTKAIELKDDYAMAYQSRGNIYERQGNLDLALKDYRKVIAVSPDSVAAYEGLSSIYKQYYQKSGKKEELTESEKCIDKAIERSPENVNLYRKRAEINVLFKDYREAIEDYTKIIELTAKQQNLDYRAMMERGKAYMELKEYEEAFENFNECYKVFQTEEVSEYRKKALWERDKAKKEKEAKTPPTPPTPPTSPTTPE